MNQNECSADRLSWWIAKQKEMRSGAEAHQQSLKKIHDASANASVSGKADVWLIDALERQQGAIDHLTKSIEKAEEYLEDALAGRLHDPHRG